MIMTLQEFDGKTITYDNGLEFTKHGFVNDLLGCEPYHTLSQLTSLRMR
jgi:IS30 family transposase